jgi:tetratricopeptide (TPR) repeat protein
VRASRFASVEHLASIERELAARPDDAELRFERARCLDDLGRIEDAMYAYRGVVLADPRHFGALTNLGTMFVEQDRLEGAAVCFNAALAAQPADPLAHLNLAVLHVAAGDRDAAEAAYTGVLARFPDDAQARLHAHNGLARLFERAGDLARAGTHAAAALERPIVWTFPYRGAGTPLRVLVLSSPRGGDLMTNQFFDDGAIERIVIVPDSFHAGDALPPHDLIFNAIGEADAAGATLERAADVVARSGAPVINDPRAVMRTDRAAMMDRLAGVPGVIAPRTQRFARADLTPDRLAAAGFTFPLLVRSPGFHAGTHFERIERPDALAATLATLPGDAFYAIAYHDGAGVDGWVRKYRVLFVDGRLFPIHLALARQWKVHYFSAEMSERADHRDEERAFLDDVERVLGSAGMAALASIERAVRLEYGGVDFGRHRDGRLIVFEANATMTVNAPPDDPRWEYRRAAYARAIDAVRTLIHSRAHSR